MRAAVAWSSGCRARVPAGQTKCKSGRVPPRPISHPAHTRRCCCHNCACCCRYDRERRDERDYRRRSRSRSRERYRRDDRWAGAVRELGWGWGTPWGLVQLDSALVGEGGTAPAAGRSSRLHRGLGSQPSTTPSRRLTAFPCLYPFPPPRPHRDRRRSRSREDRRRDDRERDRDRRRDDGDRRRRERSRSPGERKGGDKRVRQEAAGDAGDEIAQANALRASLGLKPLK